MVFLLMSVPLVYLSLDGFYQLVDLVSFFSTADGMHAVSILQQGSQIAQGIDVRFMIHGCQTEHYNGKFKNQKYAFGEWNWLFDIDIQISKKPTNLVVKLKKI